MTRRTATKNAAWFLHLVAAVFFVTGCSGQVTPREDVARTSASQALSASSPLQAGAGTVARDTWSRRRILRALRVIPPRRTIPNGLSARFRAEGIFSDGRHEDLTSRVRWSVTSGTATISNAPGTAGTATSDGVGVSTIEASDADSRLRAMATLTVTAATLRSVVVTPPILSVPLGFLQELTATGIYTDGTTQDLTNVVTWSSSSNSVVVLNDGLVIAASLGSAKITAIHPATGLTGGAVVTATAALLESLRVAPLQALLAVGFSRGFAATGTYSDGSQRALTASVTWSSSDSSVAVVSNAAAVQGQATGIAVGTASIVATDPATGLSASTTLTVTPGIATSLAIVPSLASAPIGFTQQFTAVATFSDGSTADVTAAVTWGITSGTAFISDDPAGLASGFEVGTNVVEAFDPISGLSATALLNVTAPALLRVSISPPFGFAPVGGTEQFTAVGFFSDGSSVDLTAGVTWDSSDDQTVVVSNAAGSEGLATGIAPGTATVTATDPATGLGGSVMFEVFGQ